MSGNVRDRQGVHHQLKLLIVGLILGTFAILIALGFSGCSGRVFANDGPHYREISWLWRIPLFMETLVFSDCACTLGHCLDSRLGCGLDSRLELQ